MAIRIVDSKDSFRLVTDEHGNFAVVEVRAGHVYSVHGSHRREARDSEAGIAQVVGEDGWFDERRARACLDEAARRGEDYARMIW